MPQSKQRYFFFTRVRICQYYVIRVSAAVVTVFPRWAVPFCPFRPFEFFLNLILLQVYTPFELHPRFSAYINTWYLELLYVVWDQFRSVLDC